LKGERGEYNMKEANETYGKRNNPGPEKYVKRKTDINTDTKEGRQI
jgi:hypothetical protein